MPTSRQTYICVQCPWRHHILHNRGAVLARVERKIHQVLTRGALRPSPKIRGLVVTVLQSRSSSRVPAGFTYSYVTNTRGAWIEVASFYAKATAALLTDAELAASTYRACMTMLLSVLVREQPRHADRLTHLLLRFAPSDPFLGLQRSTRGRKFDPAEENLEHGTTLHIVCSTSIERKWITLVSSALRAIEGRCGVEVYDVSYQPSQARGELVLLGSNAEIARARGLLERLLVHRHISWHINKVQ